MSASWEWVRENGNFGGAAEQHLASSGPAEPALISSERSKGRRRKRHEFSRPEAHARKFPAYRGKGVAAAATHTHFPFLYTQVSMKRRRCK
jgi:hypothetical protein